MCIPILSRGFNYFCRWKFFQTVQIAFFFTVYQNNGWLIIYFFLCKLSFSAYHKIGMNKVCSVLRKIIFQYKIYLNANNGVIQCQSRKYINQLLVSCSIKMRFTLSRKSSPCRGFKFLSTELKSANISTDSRGTRVQLRACRENCHHLVNVTLSAYQLRPKSTDQSGP